MEKKDLIQRVAWWAMFLQEFDCEIEHRSGTRMRHSDSLSRYPIIAVVVDGFIERVGVAQQTDDHLKLIKKCLENGPVENYCLFGGLVYRSREDGYNLLCIPQGMQHEVIKNMHERGHFGSKKTMELLNREYYIPSLLMKVQKVIKNCIPCILSERKLGRQECYLNPIPKEDTPLSTYHVDHLGPMTMTKKQYGYIFVVIDGFTKFVWLHPVKALTSKEVIQKLDIQKVNFGSPSRIITDRGTAFTSNEFEQYCSDEKIRHILITTGVPRGNGQVERIHRIIVPALTKMSLHNPEFWYKYVNSLQMFINSSWQRTVEMSPFKLLFGVEMRVKEDLSLSQCIEEAIAHHFNDHRNELRKAAKIQIVRAQEENVRNFNKKRKQANKYKAGDIVAIKKTQFGTGQKILPKFLGPYKITLVKDHDRYNVQKIGDSPGPQQTTTSADNMKIWRTVLKEFELDNDEDILSSDAEPEEDLPEDHASVNNVVSGDEEEAKGIEKRVLRERQKKN